MSAPGLHHRKPHLVSSKLPGKALTNGRRSACVVLCWPNMAIRIPKFQIHQVMSKPLPLQHPSPPRPCIVLAFPSFSLLRLERPSSFHRRATTGTTQTPSVTHATLLLKRSRRHPGEALTIYIYIYESILNPNPRTLTLPSGTMAQGRRPQQNTLPGKGCRFANLRRFFCTSQRSSTFPLSRGGYGGLRWASQTKRNCDQVTVPTGCMETLLKPLRSCGPGDANGISEASSSWIDLRPDRGQHARRTQSAPTKGMDQENAYPQETWPKRYLKAEQLINSMQSQAVAGWIWLDNHSKSSSACILHELSLIGIGMATLALASPPLWALAQATASLSEATQPRHGLGCHVRC